MNIAQLVKRLTRRTDTLPANDCPTKLAVATDLIACMQEPGRPTGARTLNQWLKRPLLYH